MATPVDRPRTKDRALACVIGIALALVYNANGREIPSFDSQPTKFAARELLLRGTLTLNPVVAAAPALRERHSFVLDADGNYRSAYSPVGSIAAAVIAWPFAAVGALDPASPDAPILISVLAASLLTAAAVAVSFLTARRYLDRGGAVMVAVGLGLGTGLWSTVSQTLWQHELVVLGLAIAVHVLSTTRLRLHHAVLAGVWLGVACGARLQILPAAGLLLLGIAVCHGWRIAAAAVTPVVVALMALTVFNMRVHGHALGAVPLLEALHPQVHATVGSFRWSWDGPAGLLVSPNRGLLIFSPVVLVALLGLRHLNVAGWRQPVRWCYLAALAQYGVYAGYSVWWGGHTYGPRYMLDVLPLLVIPAAAGLAGVRPRSWIAAGSAVALTWSILAAGIGAFVYPAEQWNSNPLDVDRHHERLWDWSDMQVVRAVRQGWNDRNFMLFRDP